MKPPSSSLTALLAAVALGATALAQENNNFMLDPYASDKIVRLNGTWRFSIGDDLNWAQTSFDDSDWSFISAPDDWEGEGYRRYDGFAWYRKTFHFPKRKADQQTFISLGEIDDADQVYINGQLVGASGGMPPEYETAWSQKRCYFIPAGLLVPGEENLVAVRVYDGGQDGGIRRGPLGIYETEIPPIIADLSGKWNFRTGDNPDWAQPEIDLDGFEIIDAPRAWDDQGFRSYDGPAWYRREFSIDTKDLDGNLIMLLGKIDDIDEVFLNGEKIGGTGDFDHPNSSQNDRTYAQSRAYYFPASKLKETNTIAIRVYDTHQIGGIYEGPMGIVTQKAYIAYWEERRKSSNWFNEIRRAFD